ncbi:MAG: hypothetical protein ACRCZI_07515 [Cetobacterium sp.]
MTFISITDVFNQVHDVNIDFIVEIITKGESTIVTTMRSSFATKLSRQSITEHIEHINQRTQHNA